MRLEPSLEAKAIGIFPSQERRGEITERQPPVMAQDSGDGRE